MSDAPRPIDPEEFRAYLAHWKRVGPILERLKRRELRMMSSDRHRQALLDLLELARPELARDHVCGLAEFYRKWRRA